MSSVTIHIIKKCCLVIINKESLLLLWEPGKCSSFTAGMLQF